MNFVTSKNSNSYCRIKKKVTLSSKSSQAKETQKENIMHILLSKKHFFLSAIIVVKRAKIKCSIVYLIVAESKSQAFSQQRKKGKREKKRD